MDKPLPPQPPPMPVLLQPPPMPGMPPPLPRTRPPTTQSPSLWRQSIAEPRTDVDHPDEVGFGGWLSFVAVTLFGALLNVGNSLRVAGGVFFNPDRWSRLTSPDSPYYDPYWSTLIHYQLLCESTLFALDLLVLGLMFARWKMFRISAMIFYGMALAYLLGEYFLACYIPAIGNQFGAQTVKAVLLKIAATVFGLSYLANSHRVRNTFVK